VAIIGIIYGALGILCDGWGMIASLLSGAAPQSNQPFQMPPDVVAYNATTAAIGFLLSLLVLIGSIGALRLRPWARTLLIAFAVLDILFDVAKFVITLTWAGPKIQRMFAEHPVSDPNAQKFITAMNKWGTVGGAILSVVIIALPIAILFVMNSRSAKAAFGAEQDQGIPPGAFPPPPQM
jgi:hypothetical protein